MHIFILMTFPQEATTNEATTEIVITGILNSVRHYLIELYTLDDVRTMRDYGIGIKLNDSYIDHPVVPIKPFPAEGMQKHQFLYVVSIFAIQTGHFDNFFGFQLKNVFDGEIQEMYEGDDAVCLFKNDDIVDIYGNITHYFPSWNYNTGWAYRKKYMSPNRVFHISEWMISGPYVMTEGVNVENENPFPLANYTMMGEYQCYNWVSVYMQVLYLCGNLMDAERLI